MHIPSVLLEYSEHHAMRLEALYEYNIKSPLYSSFDNALDTIIL